MVKQQQSHIVIVTYPAKGHINPALQFAIRLIRLGVNVTFFTTVSAHRRRMIKSPPPNGLSFASFSDGYDDRVVPEDDRVKRLDQLKRNGSKALADLIVSTANKQHIVYTLLLPWAADVARELHLPSTLLWIQPAMVLDIYYYYFNGFANVIRNDNNDDYPSSSIKLPGLPLFTSRDLPSFLLASNTHASVLPIFQAHFEALEKESNPRVLVNTFDALEPEALKAIEKFNLQQSHYVIVTYPAQGHINPALQFAERLIRLGVHVTFFTTIGAHHRSMIKSPPPDGLSFATFSDGYDDGVVPVDDRDKQWDQLKRNGSKALADLIVSTANKQCIVYTMLLHWAADVARELHLPSVLLWIQPAMVLDICYYYYNGFADVVGNDSDDRPSCSIQLPGMPLLLATCDLPSFLLDAFAHPIFQAQIEALEKESIPRVLVNTFDALEPEALKAFEKLNL
ncbi:crocetin glucosyltransferase, partial [Quercus suber]